MPQIWTKRQIFAEEKPGHDRRDRRHQIEQRRHFRDFAFADQVHQTGRWPPIESTRTSQAMANISSPLIVIARVSNASEASRHQDRAAEILIECSGHQVCSGAESFLPDGADAHADDGNDRGRQRRRGDAASERAEFRRQHRDDAGKADCQAQPVARQDFLAEQRPGKDSGNQGLQSHDQGGNAGRHAVADRPENTAKIDAVHQRSGC